MNCIYCYKTYSSKCSLKIHLYNNTCKADILNCKLKLYHLALNYIDKKYIIQNTCIFCNKKYCTKYTFERHLSSNSCKAFCFNNQYNLHIYIINFNKKVNNIKLASPIKQIEQIQQKKDRTQYLKIWKEQNKDKVQLYREKYQQKLNNFIEQNNHQNGF